MAAEGPCADRPSTAFGPDRKALRRRRERGLDGDRVVRTAVIKRDGRRPAEPFVKIGVHIDVALAVKRYPRLIHRPASQQRPARVFLITSI